jgi:hypothetical protein
MRILLLNDYSHPDVSSTAPPPESGIRMVGFRTCRAVSFRLVPTACVFRVRRSAAM